MQCENCVFNKPVFIKFCEDNPHKVGLLERCNDFKSLVTESCLQCGRLLDAEELFSNGEYCYQHAESQI